MTLGPSSANIHGSFTKSSNFSQLFFFEKAATFELFGRKIRHLAAVPNKVCIRLKLIFCVKSRVSNHNFAAHYDAERNPIVFAHIPLIFAPNLRLKLPFLVHQQCGILFAINVFFLIYF